MRLRRMPIAGEEIVKSPLLVQDPHSLSGHWREALGLPQNAVLNLEIGMGKGNYITGMAREYTDQGWIGLELREEMIYLAMRRLQGLEPPNLRFVWKNAVLLPEFFAEGEISRIMLPFSDPWPKSRHAKRRLTYSSFLAIYEKILADDGRLCYKTDNRDFFFWSREMFIEEGWQIIIEDRDLAMDDAYIPTEYELRFRGLGQPIYYLELAKPPER